MLEMLNLSWSIQVPLVAGYLGYVLGYLGIRSHHTGTDIALKTIAFALPASLALFALTEKGYGPGWSVPAALFASLCTAVVWRVFLKDGIPRLARHLDYSWSNDDQSAWASLIYDDVKMVTQVALELDNGEWLMCENISAFNHAAKLPLTLGPQGDVTLYVTHRRAAPVAGRTSLWRAQDVVDAEWGDQMTFVPAHRIRQLTLRHLRSAPTLSASAAATTAQNS